MISVAAAFAIVLSLGFQLRRHAASLSDDAFGAIAGVSICALACFLVWAVRGFPMPGRGARIRSTKEGDYRVVEHRTRAQIAYESDPRRTASCKHLRPLELAMRQAGIVTRLSRPPAYVPAVTAVCRINEAELRRTIHVPESVGYFERYESERARNDIAIAELVCAACRESDAAHAVISVYHPSEGGKMPWFPAPPPAPTDGQ